MREIANVALSYISLNYYTHNFSTDNV